jgi:twitching motility protein PilT
MLSSLINEILRSSAENDASDVILRTETPPLFRIDGDLFSSECASPSNEDMDTLWDACRAHPSDLDHDASLSTESGERFRVNLHRQLGQRGAVLRRIRRNIPTMETLGAPAELLMHWAKSRSGIIIIAGPTGSGKSTTMAALLDSLNRTASRHIVTIEDPVEYLFESRLSYFTQREVGIDTPTFAEGLRRSLRQNPDVIFLGEVRDRDSASTALQASETGHLVLTTLHASNVKESIERMESLFAMEDLGGIRKILSSQLLGVLCQRLPPSTHGGRALVCEYFTNSGSARNLIAEGRSREIPELFAKSDPRQAKAFSTSLGELLISGILSEETAMEFSDDPQDFARKLRGISSTAQATRR